MTVTFDKPRECNSCSEMMTEGVVRDGGPELIRIHLCTKCDNLVKYSVEYTTALFERLLREAGHAT